MPGKEIDVFKIGDSYLPKPPKSEFGANNLLFDSKPHFLKKNNFHDIL